MPENDPDDVMEAARERQHERAQHTEDILDDLDALLREQKYPVTTEELARTYADQEIDVPNETESLGSALDRLAGRDEQFASVDEAREAIYGEITGEAAGDEEYNDERALGALDDATGEPVDEDDQPDHA
jgi:hypothetical protein